MKKKVSRKKKNPGFERFWKASDPNKHDPVAMTLRTHLLAEYYLDQIIVVSLARGDLLVNQHLTFYNKMSVVKAIDVVDDRTMDALAALNNLRNRCAHDMDYQISETDVDKVGRPFGLQYTREKHKDGHDLKFLLNLQLAGILGHLDKVLLHHTKK